jgi:DNA-binding NtrC family response regulator
MRDEIHQSDTGGDGSGLADSPARDLRSRVLAYERGLILNALQASGGNQRRAAAMLGLLPTTFHEKLKRHGIRPRAAVGTEGDRPSGDRP